MSHDKNHNKSQVTLNKKAAYTFAKSIFGIEGKDFAEESGSLIAPFHISLPLYSPGPPKILFVPLKLFFFSYQNYSDFTVTLSEPFFVNIERMRLEKITSVSSVFLSRPEGLKLVQPLKTLADEIPELGVMYFYKGDDPSKFKGFKFEILDEIRRDLIIIFAMLTNHLGVSVDYMMAHAGIGCSELILDE